MITESLWWTLGFLVLFLLVVRVWTFVRAENELFDAMSRTVSDERLLRRFGDVETLGIRVRPIHEEADRVLRNSNRESRGFWIAYMLVFLVVSWLGLSPFVGALLLALMMMNSLRRFIVLVAESVGRSKGTGRKLFHALQIVASLGALYAGNVIYAGATTTLTSLANGLPAVEGLLRVLNGTVCIWAAVAWLRSIGRSAARSRDSNRIENSPASVLWLRSFRDDMISLRGTDLYGPVSHLVGPRVRMEELVVPWVNSGSLGQVHAIGKPGEERPLLGAVRSYVGDDEWQGVVAEAMKECGVVLILCGSTQGLGWELQEMHRLGDRSKALILLPPLDIENALDRLRMLRAQLDLSDLDALGLHDDENYPQLALHMTAIGFSGTGRPVYYVGRSRSEASLRASIRLAVAHARGHVEPRQHGEIQRLFDPAFPLTPQ